MYALAMALSFATGARGTFILGRIRIDPHRAGRLEFRLTVGKLVGPKGETLPLRAEQADGRREGRIGRHGVESTPTLPDRSALPLL